MQPLGGDDMGFDQGMDRFEGNRAGANLIGQRGLRQSMPSSRYPNCAAKIATAAPVLPAGQMNFPASSRLM